MYFIENDIECLAFKSDSEVEYICFESHWEAQIRSLL